MSNSRPFRRRLARAQEVQRPSADEVAPAVQESTRRTSATTMGLLGLASVVVVGSMVVDGQVVTPLPDHVAARSWGGITMSTTTEHSVVHGGAMDEASPVVARLVTPGLFVTGAPTFSVTAY